jgi:hypothetical protein
MKRKTVIQSAARLSALLVLVGALAPHARASVQFTGVLSTGSHVVAVDTVMVTDEGGGTDTFPTPSWHGDSLAVDTFPFPPIDYGPSQVDLVLTVDGAAGSLSILGPMKDSWYIIPSTPTQAKVKFLWSVGVDEHGQPGHARAGLTVSPSIVGAGATIRAERVAGTNCAFEFYDVAGNRVRTLRTQASASGAAAATWTGEDDLGRRLPEGIYYCCLADATNPSVRKLILAR